MRIASEARSDRPRDVVDGRAVRQLRHAADGVDETRRRGQQQERGRKQVGS